MVDYDFKILNAQGLPVIDFESETLACLGRYALAGIDADQINRILYCYRLGTFTQDKYVNMLDYLPLRMYEISNDFRYLSAVVVAPLTGLKSSVFLFGPLSLAIDAGVGKLGTGLYGLEMYDRQGGLTYSDSYVMLDVLQTVDLESLRFAAAPGVRVPYPGGSRGRYGYCWLSRIKHQSGDVLEHGRTASTQAPSWYVDRYYTPYTMSEIHNIGPQGLDVMTGPVRAHLWKPNQRPPSYVHPVNLGGVSDVLAFVHLPPALDQLPIQQITWY